MAAYRRRYTRSASHWADHHARSRASLNWRFGGIDEDIEQIFLSLDRRSLDLLLAQFAKKYGDGPAQYARATHPRWKSGAVKLSGKTAARLLELVPPFLGSEVRYQLIQKLRDRRLRKLSVDVHCTPDDWREAVKPAITQVIEHYRSQELPSDVTTVATWLTDNDSLAAQRLLLRAAEAHAEIRTSLLDAEFSRIQALVLEHRERRIDVKHTIDVPQGRVNVRIRNKPRPILAGLIESIRRLLR